MAELVKLGGCILHINPVSMFNHGFYNLNPTLYNDFYSENGFKLLYLKAVVNMVFAPQLVDVPTMARIEELPANATLVCAARRVSHQPVRWPMQAKYRLTPHQAR
jgi:hypothetical protein